MQNKDLSVLLNEAETFAKSLLKKHGEFFPFGFVLLTTGEIRLVQPSDGTEHPESKVLIDIMQDEMAAAAARNELRACAICWDCLVAMRDNPDQKRDAIAIHLENMEGQALVSFLPYTKRFLLAPKYFESFTDNTSPKVFAA